MKNKQCDWLGTWSTFLTVFVYMVAMVCVETMATGINMNTVRCW